jgi:plastocyanin
LFRPIPRLLARGGAALVLTLALAACASGSASSAPAAAPTAAPTTAAPGTAAPTAAPTTPSAAPSTAGGGGTATAVSIKDFSFDPAAISAKVGQEITWTNAGNATHTVTFETGGVDSGSLSKGETFKHTFDAAGAFAYKCSFHSQMQGTVTVAP